MSSTFAWIPNPEVIKRSNVWRFMQRHGIKDAAELHRRSVEDMTWFWDAVVKELPIEFFEPYLQVFDDSNGIAWCKWFVGGKINLTHNCLDRHAQGTRESKAALLWEGEDGAVRQMTYAELFTETNRLANALKRLNIRKGDRVGLFMPMIPETVVAFLAIAKIGAICIPCFSGFGGQAVAARLADGEAELLITANGFYRKGNVIEMKQTADEAVQLSPTVKHVIVFERLQRETPWIFGRDVWWHDAVAKESATCPTESMDSEDPFMIVYTSGTTGKPKGAVHVHGGFLVKIAQEVCHQTDLQDGDILYWFSDMGWIMGPWEIVGGLALGGTVFLYEGAPDYPATDRLWSMIARHRITILGISPTLVRGLMKHGDEPVRKHDLSSLRILGSTGEPWNTDPWLWYFNVIGGGRCPIINLSGGTEVGACFLSPSPLTPLKPCTVGGPSLGMAVDIFDAEGRSIMSGQWPAASGQHENGEPLATMNSPATGHWPLATNVGELVCTKPWPGMTRGMWKDPKRFEETYWSRWPNVWVHGDWASCDADGLWFLHGRSDDTIKIAGKRLGPAEVESALVSHPAVAESAAIGVPHELKGESIWCFAVLKSGHEPSDDLRRQLRECVVAALGKSFAPDQIKFVKELPKTRNAKILRRAIRAKVLQQDAGDLSSLENPSSLDEIVRAV